MGGPFTFSHQNSGQGPVLGSGTGARASGLRLACLLLFISQPAMAPDPHCCFCRVCAGENEALHTQVCSPVLLTSDNRVQGVGQGALSSLGGGAINMASRIQVTVASLSNNCNPDAREHRRVPSSSWHCLLQNGLE